MLSVASDLDEGARGMRIGELAGRAGVTLRTLRYYEGLGLIRPVPRRPGGFRFYDEATLQRIERIRRLKELFGFSLDEVRRFLASEDAVAALRARYLSTDDRAERLGIVREAVLETERLVGLIEHKQALLAEMRQRLDERLVRYRELVEEMTRP